ncbi:transporter substrate-binding domain-containing protein [Opitutus sp. ER46]|uniref:PAS domain-containing protein n=1 Tax=Opitutus sp. ER46 TaxID=2161864 RepID=UPI001304DB42|nr:transporter substrate-binding domain-containing protein [Opitutus sp. ER46]
MLLRLRWLIAVLGSVTALTAAPRLRVGVDRAAPPLAYVDDKGQPTGFTVELLREMSRVSGVEIEIIPGFWKEHIPEFNAGRLHAYGNVLSTPTNEAEMALSIAHAELHGMVFQRRDRPPIRRRADFAGRTVATMRSSAAYSEMLRNRAWGAKLLTYETWQQALDATHRGECDAAFMSTRLMHSLINEHGLARHIITDVTYRFHFGVHKGDQATLNLLNEALATVMRNGTFDELYAKWIGPIEPRRLRFADVQPFLLPIGFGLCAVAIFIGWQRHMLARLARQAEALRLSEQRWKFALESSGAAVWDWNMAERNVLYSHDWKALLGYADDEFEPTITAATRLIHPEDRSRLKQALRAHLRNQSAPFTAEYRMRCKDGSWKWILNRGVVVRRDAHGHPLRMVGTHTDLTLQRHAEEDRIVRAKLESTGLLAGGIAHDFNNLLAAIVLNTDLASWPKATREDINRHLAEIRKAAMSAHDLTQQFITFATGGVSVRRPTALEATLRNAAELALRGSSCRFELQLTPDLWMADVDAAQIGQVIRNLVLNAREAMPHGGTVTVSAENLALRKDGVPGLESGRYVRINIHDTGIGIPRELLATVFDPYFSTKQRGPQKGMGLGLTISLSIVKQHGGTILVHSSPQEATTFSIYLPACDVMPTPPATTTRARPAVPRVLVMDDEEGVKAALGGVIRQFGYEVALASDGAEAVEHYRHALEAKQPFTVVILDLTVRGAMGGLEALEGLRRLDPDVCAIVMSGYADNEALRQYTQYGFRASLTKPFTVEKLREALAAAMPPA